MNDSFMQSWVTLSSKFDALNKREQWLVVGALLFVVYSVINSLLLSPVLARQKIVNTEMTANQTQIEALQQQINVLNSQHVVDPDTENKQKLAALQATLKQLETQLNGMQSTLISPEKMPELLRSLLKKNGKLKLISLKTLPVKNVLEGISIDKSNANPTTSDQPVTNVADATAYKHGVEITIEGRYLDLLGYITELEKMPWQVLWAKAALTTDQHPPLSQLTLTVYTLSLDQAWLSI